MEIKDKIAVVTGASSGIGKATAELLAKKGAKVALVARSTGELNELSKGLPNSFVVTADLMDDKKAVEMLKEVNKHFGRIDILVNNAGRGYSSSIEEIDVDDLRQIFDLNIVTPVILMKEAAKLMKDGGAIVNVSSGTVFRPTPNLSAYSSTKRALTGFSLAAREELKDKGIIVSTVYPYVTDTDFYPDMINPPSDGRMPTEGRPSADSAEYVAELILKAIENRDVEILAHDWMSKRETMG